MVFGRKTSTNGEWKKQSSIQILSNETYINQVWGLRNFTVNANEASYVDNLLIIDLTESFGSGNEPEAEWVDENIPWFENTASIYEGSILSEHRNEIGISLTNEYLVEQMECSNADIEIEGDKIVLTNIKGEVSCRVKTKDTIAPSSSFTIGSSTTGSNGWYKAVTIQANLSDNGSGVSSAKYCTTTGSTCTPNVDASISNNAFTVTLGSNTSAQKVCIQATDVSGNTSGVNCSNVYKVDTTNPTAKISASSSGSNITVSASGSSDAHSGIASYQYSKDNKTWYTSTSASYTFTNLSNGTYTVYIKITDKSGRVSNIVSTTVKVNATQVLLSNGVAGTTNWNCNGSGDSYTATCSYTGSGLEVSASSGHDNVSTLAQIKTVKMIDITNFSTLNFTGYANRSKVTLELIDSSNSIAARFSVTLSSNQTTVNLSPYTGSYYIRFRLDGGGSSALILRLYNVSLIP